MFVLLLSALGAQPSRPLDGAAFVGFNVVNLQSGNFSTDGAYVRATANALHAGVLRYPGGNLADWWDWRTGWCVENVSIPTLPMVRNPCYGGRSGSKPKRQRVYRLEEFKIALERTGATAVIMLNMLTSTLDEQLSFLHHARNIGALSPHAYVELGGEFYWGKFAGRWARASDYGVTAVQWSRAIKASFPDVRTLAVACHSFEYAHSQPNYRGRAWNSELYPVVAAPESTLYGVVMHPYLHLGNDTVGGGVLQPLVPPRQKGEEPTGWSTNATVQRAMASLLSSSAGMEALLGIPSSLSTLADGDLATQVRLPKNLRLVITEYNVMERAGPFKLSWAHALFIVASTMHMLSVPAVDAVLLHCLLNGFGWGALYETTADFERGGGVPPKGSSATAQSPGQGCLIAGCQGLFTMPYSPTAVGTALGAVSASMSSARTATDLRNSSIFPLNPKLTGVRPSALPGNVTYDSLLAWRFDADMDEGASTTNITVVNLSARQLPALLPTEMIGSIISSWSSPSIDGPLAWASLQTPVRVSTSVLRRQQPVQLPPYSITVVAAGTSYVTQE